MQWEMSTERSSLRDWPDVWLTPWSDNLTLPFDEGDVDLQGVPSRGIHLSAVASQSSWGVSTIANSNESALSNAWWESMGSGITAGTNQAAIRQTFKLTLTPGHVRFERSGLSDGNQHRLGRRQLLLPARARLRGAIRSALVQPEQGWRWLACDLALGRVRDEPVCSLHDN